MTKSVLHVTKELSSGIAGFHPDNVILIVRAQSIHNSVEMGSRKDSGVKNPAISHLTHILKVVNHTKKISKKSPFHLERLLFKNYL
jgi:hypothetical protein